MKKIMLFTVMFLTCFECFSQNVVHSTNRGDLAANMIDSVKYVTPEFQTGIVIFKTGEKTEAKLNISTIDQTLRFIDENGEVLSVRNQDDISRVSIKGRTFVRGRGIYVELLDMSSDVILGVCRKVNFLETEKQGAYGKASPTTSVTSVSSYADNGYMYDLNQNLTTPFLYKQIPYLYKNGVFYLASKKAFTKCFPDKKAEIQSYIDEKKVDFSDMDQVRPLFIILGR